jgi:gas vesicle protein
MELTKQTEEILKTWTDVQKKSWEGWLETIKSYDASQPAQVWEKTINTWQDSVKRTLEAQAEGSRIWAESVTSVQGAPKEVAEWAKQVQEMTQRWTEVQQQLWDNWFEVAKKADPSKIGETWGGSEGQNILQAWQDVAQKVLNTQSEWAKTLTGKSE